MNGESPAYVKEQMGHSSIQVTVDLYCHWIPGSNRQAVDRLDEVVDIPKIDGQSATIRNQTQAGQMGEERFPLEVLENYGAGDLDRTGDLRFTNVSKALIKRLGVSNGFPVSYLNTDAWKLYSGSTDFNGSCLYGQLLAQI